MQLFRYLWGSTCTNSSSRVYIAAGSKPRAMTFTTGNILLRTKVIYQKHVTQIVKLQDLLRARWRSTIPTDQKITASWTVCPQRDYIYEVCINKSDYGLSTVVQVKVLAHRHQPGRRTFYKRHREPHKVLLPTAESSHNNFRKLRLSTEIEPLSFILIS